MQTFKNPLDLLAHRNNNILYISGKPQEDSKSLIKNLKLEIQHKKTKIVEFKSGVRVSKDELQYLGFTYDGRKILLRDTGLAKYSHKVMKAIKMSNKTFNDYRKHAESQKVLFYFMRK